MAKSKPGINGEGVIHDRTAQLKELRETQKALQRDLAQHRDNVKSTKAELVKVGEEIGTAIDDFEQPLLNFDGPAAYAADEGRE